MTREGADPHADQRERKQRHRRYGMRVTGRSVKLLARLSADPTRKQAPKKRKRRQR